MKKAIFNVHFQVKCVIIVLNYRRNGSFCFTEQIINIDRMENAVALFGSFDGNIKLIEKGV